MNLKNWLNDKRIVEYRSSPGEIAELFLICDRDLEKANIPELGPDWQLSIAHNAAIQAAKAALAALGYRARKEGQHYILLQSLAFTVKMPQDTIDQLNKFREKRNISDYERAGMVTEYEAQEMLTLAKKVRDEVEAWIRTNYPHLIREV